MSRQVSASPRVPISLRLPRDVIDTVSAFAESRHMSKTDAFLHFLRQGITKERCGGSPQLQHISSQLDQVLSLLSGHESHTADASHLSFIAQAIRQAASQFDAIERAYLFGSFARGDETEDSDVDIRLELAKDARFTLRDLDHFAKSVERATGRSVDVLTARTIQNQALADAFERDKVMVYERQTS